MADQIESQTFDTAAECESELLKRQTGAKREGKAAAIDFANAFQCIASDDPRLAK
jgi:hypothetical protein